MNIAFEGEERGNFTEFYVLSTKRTSDRRKKRRSEDKQNSVQLSHIHRKRTKTNKKSSVQSASTASKCVCKFSFLRCDNNKNLEPDESISKSSWYNNIIRRRGKKPHYIRAKSQNTHAINFNPVNCTAYTITGKNDTGLSNAGWLV